MQIKTKTADGVTVVYLSGSLDADSVEGFKKTTSKLIGEGKYTMVMDCSGLEFVDSMGLGAMISLLRRVRVHQGDLKMAAIHTDVKQIFEITRLNHLFEVFPDWQSACQEF